MKCSTLAAGAERAAGRRPMGSLGGVLTAVVLASIAGCSAALVSPVGQARTGRSRAAHGAVGGGGGWRTSAKSPLGLETGGFGRVRSRRTRSESGSDSVVRVQAFWDTGRVGGGAAGRKKVAGKAKPTFVSPVPEGFPPASTLLRPDEVDYTLGNFLDVSREMFKKNNPSWWQSARFRLKPLGRIPSRTRIVRITLDGGASLNLVPKPQVFGMKELDLYGCTTALKTAAHDPRIKGVLMDLSSVEMSMATIMEVRRAMDYFTQSGKPLWGFTENFLDITLLCLMGGCTKRIAAPEVYVNLLGFSFETQFFRGFFDQVGIEPQVRRIGEFKSFGDTYARDSMSAAQREVTESLLSAVSGFKGGLLARDAGDKAMSDVEDLYNSDDPITVDKLTAFGLLDDVMYQDQMLDAFNVEVDRRFRKGSGKEEGDNESDTSTAEKKPAKKSKKKKRLVETSKLIIPATVYLRRVRRSEVEGVPGGKGDKTIAVINAEGAIVNSATGGQGNLLVPNFRDQANTILRDPSVEGVVVRISSPGGDALASDLMWREVRRLREAGKVVVASVCNVAASGGYYIAMGCETIVCDELSITGSIGVVQAKFAIGELIDKLGLKIERISKGKYAELFAAERGFTKEEDAWWSRNAMISYNDFVSKAALSRRMPLEDMKRRAQGRVWTGAQAKALGLVDELGGLDRAIEVCRDMVDLKKLATDKYRAARKKARREANKEKKNAGKSTERSIPSSSDQTAPEKSSSAAMVVRAVSAEGEEFEDFGANNDLYPLAKGEVPYGPLGRVIPEKYSALEEQVVQEARDELEKKREEASESGRGRLTRVKNIVPGGSGFLGFLSSNLNQDNGDEDWMARFGISTPRAAKPSASTLLKGLSSLMSADTARPMAVLDDDIARMMPGISGVPEDLRRLGVGPLLYSFLQRSPGLAESLVEVLGKVGLSSLLD